MNENKSYKMKKRMDERKKKKKKKSELGMERERKMGREEKTGRKALQIVCVLVNDILCVGRFVAQCSARSTSFLLHSFASFHYSFHVKSHFLSL